MERLIANARQLYQNLGNELAHALRILNSGAEDLAAKGRAETIRAHRKALQTILDLEAQFEREQGKLTTGNEIDLEAARSEIYRRLDRLAAAGGD
ncbi:MAG: hypothetical protein ACK5MQ_04790 [Pikeienuella sp.]